MQEYYPVWINEKYLVYPDGRVWSEKTMKFLKPSHSKISGYLIYGIAVTKELGWSPSMHRILAHCFKGGIPPNMTVDHIDGDKFNNDLENLDIVSHAENTRRAYLKGFAKGKSGETNAMSKLTKQDAIRVFECLANGWSNDQIAKQFKLHSRYISLLRHGKRWRELYKFYGPFKESIPYDQFADKYLIFMKMKDKHTNKEIAKIARVDPSTVSRWRSGQTRS